MEVQWHKAVSRKREEVSIGDRHVGLARRVLYSLLAPLHLIQVQHQVGRQYPIGWQVRDYLHLGGKWNQSSWQKLDTVNHLNFVV